MTTHELARELLKGPDVIAVTPYLGDSLFPVRSLKLINMIDSEDCAGNNPAAHPDDRGQQFYPRFDLEPRHPKEIQGMKIG